MREKENEKQREWGKGKQKGGEGKKKVLKNIFSLLQICHQKLFPKDTLSINTDSCYC